MTLLVYIFLVIFQPVSNTEALALQRTAPGCLTIERAQQHILAARAAGLVYGLRPELLLSIAHHESRYQHWEMTKEPGSLVSCGVMTPVPKASCGGWEMTIVGGYEAGAAHLALWRTYFPRSYLYAYAGGGALVKACSSGSKNPACDIPWNFLERAQNIGNALRRARVSSGT